MSQPAVKILSLSTKDTRFIRSISNLYKKKMERRWPSLRDIPDEFRAPYVWHHRYENPQLVLTREILQFYEAEGRFL